MCSLFACYYTLPPIKQNTENSSFSLTLNNTLNALHNHNHPTPPFHPLGSITRRRKEETPPDNSQPNLRNQIRFASTTLDKPASLRVGAFSMELVNQRFVGGNRFGFINSKTTPKSSSRNPFRVTLILVETLAEANKISPEKSPEIGDVTGARRVTPELASSRFSLYLSISSCLVL
ncbi:hypothetical protein HanPSC8_Chr07g0270761 [Helianthus annuus]|nr:hypothetical protein HanPSC8_Chr07g0270761 [Helianthus annuus]